MNELSVEKLKTINERISQVLKEIQSVKEENVYLNKALVQSRNEIDSERESNKALQSELDAIKMANAISGDEPVDKHARSKINEMVKEIDRCIALMNN